MSPARRPEGSELSLLQAAFDNAVDRLGPFEAMPRLAVAVSGGADSMALCLLARHWAARMQGTIVALTVDHRLRLGSTAEARQVAVWLDVLGIHHHLLTWTGPKPERNRQAAARAARYRLLTHWCRRQGILHLLLGHHVQDQAETLLMRLARGSGLDGLAGMSALVETPALRLLRPLLATSKRSLIAFLQAQRQPWLEDPSNEDPIYDRVLVRRLLPNLAREGVTPKRLAETASSLGRGRATIDSMTADFLSEGCAIFPAGYAVLDPDVYTKVPQDVARRALARILTTISGASFAPRSTRLAALHDAIAQDRIGNGRTLGGCRIVPVPESGRGDRGLLVCREIRAMADRVSAAPGRSTVWDGRFVAVAGRRSGPLTLGGLGSDGWREVRSEGSARARTPVPALVRPTLPTLRDGLGVRAVPAIGYFRGGEPLSNVALRFAPVMAVAGSAFYAEPRTVSELAGT